MRPGDSIKGRGAAGNPAVRFDEWQREAEAPESWEAEEPSRPRTVITLQQARSIISRNASPDVPFTQSINPYQGCEHGCIYCYARPSHAYLGLSPGLDFETRLFGKANAAELLRKELSSPSYKCSLIALGANTDPYQPAEREQRITRAILEVLEEHSHPVGIVTKSSLVERDIDVLARMSSKNLAEVYVSVTTLDGDLARKLEPRAAAPHRRVETLRRLSEAGVRCGVLNAPLIPFLNDGDSEAVLEAAAAAGAKSAGYVLLRLPKEVKPLFTDWLERHFPLKAAHVLARVAELHSEEEKRFEFGERMRGSGQYAALIKRRFELACRRFGLNLERRHTLDTAQFQPPRRPGDSAPPQLSLF
jgi:DNA repair photolyase